MKRTDKLSNFIAILLFLAFVAYIGAYAGHAMKNTTVTAEAVAAEVRPGGVANGIVIRDEQVLSSAGQGGSLFIDVTAKNGAKVASGSLLATAIRSQKGLERANRYHELELEIARISAALDELNSAEDLTTRDEALRSAVDDLAAAVARHELSDLDSSALNLRSLLFSADAAGADEAQLRALERELDSLKNSTSGDTTLLYAETSGVFSTAVDGYEALSSADLKNLTPAVLGEMLSRQPDSTAGTYGKIVTDFHWYFAAVMSEDDAGSLTVGRTATLNFGRWYGADVYARVISISQPEDGSVAVVFRCDTALADTLAMRRVTANVVFEAHTGIRVPAAALHTDTEGEEPQDFVWVITAMRLERKNVTVLYQDDDFAIIARDSGVNALREGNTVVVSGDELYEGKVME